MRVPWVLQDSAMRLVLALAALAGIAVGLTIPFLTLTARDRGVSLAGIGVMASSYLFTQMLLQLPMGSLSDRVGRALPISFGLMVEAVGTAGFAFADRAWLFILLRVVQGVGVALLYPAIRALIADVTPADRRGQAYAAFGAAFSSGMLLGPAVGGVLAGSVGVNELFLSAGVLEIVVAAGNLVLMRGKGRPGRVPHPSERVPFSALLERSLIGAFILSFAGQFQIGLFSGIWSIYMADLGASDFQIGLSFSTFSVAYLVVAPVGGRLADSGARWPRLLAANLALGAVILAYGLIPSVPAILLLGLVEGSIATVGQPSLDAYLASTADPQIQGRVQGAFTTIGMAGAAISALLGSMLYAAGHLIPFVVGGGVLWVLTLIAVRLVREAEQRGGLRTRRAAPGPTGLPGDVAAGEPSPAREAALVSDTERER